MAVNESVPLEFALDEGANRPMRALTIHHVEPHRRLSLLIDGCKPVDNIPVDIVGEYARGLWHAPSNKLLYFCIDVSLLGATKIVTIRSTFQVRGEEGQSNEILVSCFTISNALNK